MRRRCSQTRVTLHLATWADLLRITLTGAFPSSMAAASTLQSKEKVRPGEHRRIGRTKRASIFVKIAVIQPGVKGVHGEGWRFLKWRPPSYWRVIAWWPHHARQRRWEMRKAPRRRRG